MKGCAFDCASNAPFERFANIKFGGMVFGLSVREMYELSALDCSVDLGSGGLLWFGLEQS